MLAQANLPQGKNLKSEKEYTLRRKKLIEEELLRGKNGS